MSGAQCWARCTCRVQAGKFRSKPWAALLEEAKHLVASGVKELNLIAEDTNQYGQVGGRLWGGGLAFLAHAKHHRVHHP